MAQRDPNQASMQKFMVVQAGDENTTNRPNAKRKSSDPAQLQGFPQAKRTKSS